MLLLLLLRHIIYYYIWIMCARAKIAKNWTRKHTHTVMYVRMCACINHWSKIAKRDCFSDNLSLSNCLLFILIKTTAAPTPKSQLIEWVEHVHTACKKWPLANTHFMWMKQFYLCHKSILSLSLIHVGQHSLQHPCQRIQNARKSVSASMVAWESHIWLDQFTSGKIINDFRTSHSKWLMLKETGALSLFSSRMVSRRIKFPAALLPFFAAHCGQFL